MDSIHSRTFAMDGPKVNAKFQYFENENGVRIRFYAQGYFHHWEVQASKGNWINPTKLAGKEPARSLKEAKETCRRSYGEIIKCAAARLKIEAQDEFKKMAFALKKIDQRLSQKMVQKLLYAMVDELAKMPPRDKERFIKRLAAL